jgi:hypothetical protein
MIVHQAILRDILAPFHGRGLFVHLYDEDAFGIVVKGDVYMQTLGPRLAASVPVDSERRRGRIATPANLGILCDKYMCQ